MDFSITAEEFQRFRTLIYDESGISLSDQKQTLLASRLSKRLRDLGLTTYSEYYTKVTKDPTSEEFTRMLDLISTNKTDFFREPKHFNFLRERIIPELASAKRIRIWSSACSTGEEPYTIAMTIFDHVTNPTTVGLQNSGLRPLDPCSRQGCVGLVRRRPLSRRSPRNHQTSLSSRAR